MINQKRDRIHILHLVRSLKLAGAEILLNEYIKALGNEKYKHIVYNFGHDGPVRGMLEAIGVNVITGPNRSSIKNPVRFLYRLIYLIRDVLGVIKLSQVQIIQSHLSHANQLAVLVAKLAKVPVFPTVHNTMEFVDRRSNLDPRVHIIKLVDWIIYNLADRIIAVSEEVKEITRKQFRLPESKLVVVKNGIIFNSKFNPPASLEEEFPASVGKLKLIAVGRLYYQKGIDILIRAIKELIESGIESVFIIIAGEGAEKDELERLAQELNVDSFINFIGVRKDIRALLMASDIFLMPSRYEGLSIAMIEAMACGLPIIATDAPGIRDNIKNNINGVLFPTENYKAMAERIYNLAKDGKIRMTLSSGARKSFTDEYDMKKNIKPLKSLFSDYNT